MTKEEIQQRTLISLGTYLMHHPYPKPGDSIEMFAAALSVEVSALVSQAYEEAAQVCDTHGAGAEAEARRNISPELRMRNETTARTSCTLAETIRSLASDTTSAKG